METILITDSCSDLPTEFINRNNIPIINFTVNMENASFSDNFYDIFTYKEFYDRIRAGEIVTTSQINVEKYIKVFTKYVLEKKSIIYLCFSSALSGSMNSALIAKDTILSEHKDADITIIDTKCASFGEGLLFYHAYNKLKNGATKEELITWIEENKLNLIHWFTVNELKYLKRGGRISSATAVVGTLLDIKPILHVDDEGRLIPMTKVKGRKKSLKTLVDKIKETIVNAEEQVIGISQSDCMEDAEFVKKQILSTIKVKDVLISDIGPVVGSHTGPGCVALFYMGQKR